MATPWAAFGTAAGLVFIEEFADKTQLILLALAARGGRWRVWTGAVAALALLTVAAALAGDLIARLVPAWAVRLLAGLLFVAFGVWSLVRREETDAAVDEVRVPGFGTAFVLVGAAELGDKTQLAVAALAAETGQTVAVAAGGVLALAVAAVLPVAAGPWLVQKVPLERIETIAAWLFVAIGALLLLSLALPTTFI